MSYKTEFQSNNIDLQSILDTVNALPVERTDALFLEEKDVSMPSSQNWSNITYGGNKFVTVTGCYKNSSTSVSASNIGAYSNDGLSWTQTTLSSSTHWNSVTYGNGKFVAIAYGVPSSTSITYWISGNSTISAYSTDGITWTYSALPNSANWGSVAYGNGKFVAIAQSLKASNTSKTTTNYAAYSTDGTTWTASTLPSKAYWRSVVYGNNKFVAVSQSNVAAYSTDGSTWTSITMPSSWWNSVTYGNGKFVAVHDTAAYSTDGITWTETTLPITMSCISVTYGNGKFVAIDSDRNVICSTDGITWTASTLPESAKWSSVTYGGGKFVAVSGNSTSKSSAFAYSTDGINWTNTKQILTDVNDVDVTVETLQELFPALSNPATAENIESGYEAIDGSGAVIAGSLNIPFKYVGSFEVQGSLVEFGGASRAIASISSISNLSGKLQKGKRYMLVLQGIGTVNHTSNCTIYGIAQMYTTSNTVSMSTLEFPDRFSVIAYKSDGVTHSHGANDTYLQMYNHSGNYLHVMNTAGYEGYLSYGYSSFNTPPTIDIYEM